MARTTKKNPTCLQQTISGDWCQEWYETSTRGHVARRAQLSESGFISVVSSPETQITPVGPVKLSLVTIIRRGGDFSELPPVKMVRFPS